MAAETVRLVIPANVIVCNGCRARAGLLPPEFVDLGFERPEKICIDCLTAAIPEPADRPAVRSPGTYPARGRPRAAGT